MLFVLVRAGVVAAVVAGVHAAAVALRFDALLDVAAIADDAFDPSRNTHRPRRLTCGKCFESERLETRLTTDRDFESGLVRTKRANPSNPMKGECLHTCTSTLPRSRVSFQTRGRRSRKRRSTVLR